MRSSPSTTAGAVPDPRAAQRLDAAAADAAAHDTLVKLYPSAARLDRPAVRGAARAGPAGRAQARGVRVGRRVAAQLLAPARPRRLDRRARSRSSPARARATTSSRRRPSPRPSSRTGRRSSRSCCAAPTSSARRRRRRSPARSTPPRSTRSRPSAPPQGSTRTPDQTQIGQFWNPPIWATWNRIAQTAALAHHGGLSQNARTFAALDLTLRRLRDRLLRRQVRLPRLAARDRDPHADPTQPDTAADPAWTPLSATAPDPSYPGAHGTISAAGADVLAAIYGNDFAFTVTSPALPGVARSFVSFSEAAEEASVSRIYNGNHTRLDQVAGENLGHAVANAVVDRDVPKFSVPVKATPSSRHALTLCQARAAAPSRRRPSSAPAVRQAPSPTAAATAG